MKTLYLAGPMTGYQDYNFPLFFSTAERLRRAGYQVISPAEMDVAAGIEYKTKPGEPGKLLTPTEIRVLIQRDITAILSLRAENGDFIACLPGWERSRGVGAEVYTGRWAGLKLKQIRFDSAPFDTAIMIPITLPEQILVSYDPNDIVEKL